MVSKREINRILKALSKTQYDSREGRKTIARCLELLGFDAYEIANFLGLSSNTVKTYLRESSDVYYNDLFNFAFRNDIIGLFTPQEQEFLYYFKDAGRKVRKLSKKSNSTYNASQGKGIGGWIAKNIRKNTEKYRKRNREINKERNKLIKEAKKRIKKAKNKKIFPHLASSDLDFKIEYASVA